MPSPQDGKAELEALRAENRRFKRAVEELTFLNELAREIGSSLDSKGIMDTVIHRSLRAVSAEQGVISLIDKRTKEPHTLIRAMVTSTGQQAYHLDHILLGWMQLNKQPLVINNPRGDERFSGIGWDESIRSILCVPLMIRSELIGVLAVYNKKKGEAFSADDQRLLAIIAAQSAQVVENARLFEEEKALLKVQEDLRLAAKIQSELLPKTAPEIAGYEIAGRSIPATMVGGDYFDYIPLDYKCVAFCLGDVSGKGLPASLLMANLQATVRGQALPDSPCKECLQRSNRLLFRCTEEEKFATLFFGILDIEKNLLSFVNAGHNPPLLFSDSEEPIGLKTGGIPLGIFETFRYEEETVHIKPGDLLVLYSDGITEATNAKEEEFGVGRLEAVVRKHRQASAGDLLEEIVAAVSAHTANAPPIDDITLVIIKRDE